MPGFELLGEVRRPAIRRGRAVVERPDPRALLRREQQPDGSVLAAVKLGLIDVADVVRRERALNRVALRRRASRWYYRPSRLLSPTLSL
jgi:hypothetical protein